MKVYIPSDLNFNYIACNALYKKYEKEIDDIDDFDKILASTMFYSFFTDDDEFIGCLYFYKGANNRLFVNGFSNRKMHRYNVQALRLSFNWFDCDIYAKTPHKNAVYCLLRAGFKKCDNQLYVKVKGE